MSEIERINAIPRRQATDLGAVAAEISRQFKTVQGTQTLRPQQAQALYELATCGGLIAAIRVGGGKTLISLIAPMCFDSRRCLLILPASLIEKTERDRDAYGEHWQVAKQLKIISYEMLGRVKSAQFLEDFQPDLIIADECHRLKNPRAAVTKRVSRYMAASPATKFVGLSGTLVRKSLRDYAHILGWALKGRSPVPGNSQEIEAWAEVLDESENFLLKPNLSPFKSVGGTAREVREWYRKRLTETPGIVVSDEGRGCNASLLLRAVPYEVDALTQAHFKKLRTTWTTPDDWPLDDPIMVWQHARQLAVGMHYIWDPRPPDEWLKPRAEWSAFCRQLIIRSRTYDSPKQIEEAVLNKQLDCPAYWRWREVRNSFTPNVRPVWHSDFAIRLCRAWAEQVGGLIWSSHSFFGRELARQLGVPYFGRKGLDAENNFIDDYRGTCVASLKANSAGRNLQHYNTSLIITLPGSGLDVEQTLGRLHREGQMADEVVFDFLYGCVEHDNALRDARADAGMIYATTGQQQKLLYLDLDVTPPSVSGENPAWGIFKESK